MSTPLVSCLCVTERRSEFMPWLLWNFAKQTYPNRELVIVDSSPSPYRSNREDVRVVPAIFGTNIPTKRNRALELARGEVVAWFDDDDWQHPERLQRITDSLQEGFTMSGSTRSWFLDVFSRRICEFNGRRRPVFNGAGFTTEAARAVPFDETKIRASDTAWLRALLKNQSSKSLKLDPTIFTCWLCHDTNISNSRKRRTSRCCTPIDRLKNTLGHTMWGDTDTHLELLRSKLCPR